MIWDVHCHFPRNWQDPDNFDAAKEIDLRADALRAAGVTRASLLSGGRFGLDYQESLVFARRHEDLFLPSAMIDPEEITYRDIKDLHGEGYRGLKMIGVRKAYDDYAYFGVYQAAEELDMPILLHMGVIGGGIDYSVTHPRRDPEAAQQIRDMRSNPRTRGRDVSAMRMRPFHMDTIANNFPNLKLIGAHMGGTGNYDEAASVTRWRHNVYLDMSGGDTIERHAVERGLVGQEIGVEKLTWGSDCGNDEIADHLANLDRIFDQVGLSEDQQHRIRYQNAAEIFGEAEPVHARRVTRVTEERPPDDPTDSDKPESKQQPLDLDEVDEATDEVDEKISETEAAQAIADVELGDDDQSDGDGDGDGIVDLLAEAGTAEVEVTPLADPLPDLATAATTDRPFEQPEGSTETASLPTSWPDPVPVSATAAEPTRFDGIRLTPPLVLLGALVTLSFLMFVAIEPTPRWLLLFTAVIAVLGTDGALRQAWPGPFRRREDPADSTPYLFLPALAVITWPMLIEHNVGGYLAVPAALLAGLAFTAVTVAQISSVRIHAPIYSIARLVSTASVYVSAFTLFSLSYVLNVELLAAVAAIAVVAAMLSVELFREGQVDPLETLVFAGVTGVILAEARWAMYYIPLSGYLAGLALLLVFFLATGLLHSHLTRRLNSIITLEYAGIAAAGVLLVAVAGQAGLG